MIALFHTAQSNVRRFDLILKKIAPQLEVKHWVNETILQQAMKDGCVSANTQNIFQKEIETIQELKPEFIICTCSTFGEECKILENKGISIKRIDEPVVEYLVQSYSKILLVYSARSTQNISRNLLLELATIHRKEIEIIEADCTSAWIHFQNNEMDRYEQTIVEIIQQQSVNAEAIFLAQASMEGVKNKLLSQSKEVLSSPEYGIKTFLKDWKD